MTNPSEDLYGMKLNHTIEFSNGYHVTRVPGGWIYIYFQRNQVAMPDGMWSENYTPTSVFVPFNNEFQEREQHGRCVHEMFSYATDRIVRCKLVTGHDGDHFF